MNVTLYRYQFVDNGTGLWKNDWFLFADQAEAARQNKIDNGYFETDEENGFEGGEENEITTIIEAIDVELTPDGILAFARNRAFAADE